MWYRAVVIVSSETSWEPRWALRQRGDGLLLRLPTNVLYFASLAELANWAMQQTSAVYVEMPSQLLCH